MRVLFTTNYYPPAALGGYEMWCQDTAHALCDQGHEVAVVTSCEGGDQGSIHQNGVTVHRAFELEVVGGLAETLKRLPSRRRREKRDIEAVRGLVEAFEPDVAVQWGMWNAPRSISALIEGLLPGRNSYYLCDYWLTMPTAYSQQLENPADRPLMRVPKKVVGSTVGPLVRRHRGGPLRLERAMCCSKAVAHGLATAGVRFDRIDLVYGGVDLSRFKTQEPRPRVPGQLPELLYLGRLSPEKGVETALRAVEALHQNGVAPRLDLFGTGDDVYVEGLKAYVREHGIADSVLFGGKISHEKVPDLMSQYDALVFPSEWEEPFARTVLEAMAAGLPVIGTTTGGTAEILFDRVSGLTFQERDASQLAEKIELLAGDFSLAAQVARVARRRVVERHSFDRMVSGIERNLLSLLPEDCIARA